MEERDPRKQPWVGDRLAKDGKERVIKRMDGGQIIYSVRSEKMPHVAQVRECWITTWQAWARNADVIERV